MNVLNVYNQFLKYDFINKFNYNSIKNLPKLNNIIILLTFNILNQNIKQLINFLFILETLFFQKALPIIFKKNLFKIKIKKENFIGSKITLSKLNINEFLLNLIYFYKYKNKSFKFEKKLNTFYTFTINILKKNMFKTFQSQYFFLKDVFNFNVNIHIKVKKKKELVFLLKTLKLYIK